MIEMNQLNAMDPDPREDKLPQWMQTRLQVLRSEVVELRRQVTAYGNPEHSLVVVNPNAIRDETSFGLDPRAPVSFQTGPSKWDRIEVQLRTLPDRSRLLYLSAHTGGLVFFPQASNCGWVRCGRYDEPVLPRQ
jgi:hypothetical protein